MSQTIVKSFNRDKDPVQKIAMPIVSDGSGNYDQTTDDQVTGALARFTFVPDGTDTPTDGCNLTLKDEGGVDILAGLGTGLSNAGPTSETPACVISDGTNTGLYPFLINDRLRLQGTGLGTAKKGTLILHLR